MHIAWLCKRQAICKYKKEDESNLTHPQKIQTNHDMNLFNKHRLALFKRQAT